MQDLLLRCVVTLLVLQGVAAAPTESEVEDVLLQLSKKELHTLADTLLRGMELEPEQRAITKRELLEDATRMTAALIEQERRAAQTGTVDESTRKLLQFLSTNPRIKRAGLAATTQLEAIKNYRENWLQKRGQLKDTDFWTDMKRDIGSTFLEENPEVLYPDTRQTNFPPDTCPFPKVDCGTGDKYRTIDGTCNNLGTDKEAWGSSHRAHSRFIDPDYGDDVDSPRLAYDGNELRSARLISRTLFDMFHQPSGLYTQLNMVFGQLLDHDISHTPAAFLATDLETLENATINCGSDGCSTFNGVDLATKECYPIPFTADDIYADGRSCIPFVRSQAYLNSNCDLTPREQANTITSWLDASMVYGSDTETTRQLVDASTGEMVMMTHPFDPTLKPLLPPSPTDGGCTGLTDVIKCFQAGDVRQNEQVFLTALHTVFARMHNHILKKLKAAYSSEGVALPETRILFQETRKLLAGLWQHIVYNEYLRTLLGPDLMEQYELIPQEEGFFKDYSEDVRPDVANAFTTAAFRFGHSEIPDMMRFASTLFDVFEEIHLSKIFFSPTTLYQSPVPEMSGVDALVLGMVSSRAETPDDHFSGQILNHLFASNPPFGPGTDLPALNIQRGRDHGIPGYAAWRRFCDLGDPQSINDIKDIPSKLRKRLQTVYDHVEDIDLFAGAILEKQAEDSQIGPTFGCIIARQFHNLKFGDRFYYENEDDDGFNEEQLTEIRHFTLARLLCDTLDEVDSIQKFVLIQPLSDINRKKVDVDFILQGDDNERRPCDMIPDLDYSKFVQI